MHQNTGHPMPNHKNTISLQMKIPNSSVANYQIVNRVEGSVPKDERLLQVTASIRRLNAIPNRRKTIIIYFKN